MADGSLLAFMNPVDLYTLFGNALDNAIEAVRKLESKEERVIDIMLYERQSFLMLQIVNPMCGEVKLRMDFRLRQRRRTDITDME